MGEKGGKDFHICSSIIPLTYATSISLLWVSYVIVVICFRQALIWIGLNI